MAKLLEYQGKEIFRRFGIPTPRGLVVRSVAEVFRALHEEWKAERAQGKREPVRSAEVQVVDHLGDIGEAARQVFS